MDGKLWRKSVEKSELESVKAAYTVISIRLVAGKPLVHVFADTAPEGFKAVEPSLEDVYFHHIAQVQAEA
jgi:hypothetical protein